MSTRYVTKRLTVSFDVWVEQDGEGAASDEELEVAVAELLERMDDGRRALSVELLCKAAGEVVEGAVARAVWHRVGRYPYLDNLTPSGTSRTVVFARRLVPRVRVGNVRPSDTATLRTLKDDI